MTDEMGPDSTAFAVSASAVLSASASPLVAVWIRRARQDPDEAGDVGADRVLVLEEAQVFARSPARHLPRRLIELLAHEELRVHLRPRRVVDDEEGELAVDPPREHRSEEHAVGMHRQRDRQVDEQVIGRGGGILGGGDAGGEAREGVRAVTLPERAELLGRQVRELGDRGEPLVGGLDGARDRDDGRGVQCELQSGDDSGGPRFDDRAERLADAHQPRGNGGPRLRIRFGRGGFGGLVAAPAGREQGREQEGEHGCAGSERWSHQESCPMRAGRLSPQAVQCDGWGG